MGSRVGIRQRPAPGAARRQHALGGAARLLGWRRSQTRHQVEPALREPPARLPERRDLTRRIDGAYGCQRIDQRLRQPLPDDLGRAHADVAISEGDTAVGGGAVGAQVPVQRRRTARGARPPSDGFVAAGPVPLCPAVPGRVERRSRRRRRRRPVGAKGADAVAVGDVAGADRFAIPD